MSRRRWVYIDGEAVEVTADREPEPRLQIVTDGHYDGLRATDGTPIDTRRRHREYMQANNLSLVSDWTNYWAKAKQERAQAFDKQRSQRIEAIKRAYDTVKNRGRNG